MDSGVVNTLYNQWAINCNEGVEILENEDGPHSFDGGD